MSSWCHDARNVRHILRRLAQNAPCIRATRLADLVRHRRLVLPQLEATGVSARQVKQLSGFSVSWGPIRAEDIPGFLANGCKADARMRRRISFTFKERLALVTVEIRLFAKQALWIALSLQLDQAPLSSYYPLRASPHCKA